MKKPILAFSIADEKNKPFAIMMENSLRKFHPDIDYHLIEGDELKDYLKLDPHFFYRATPIIAERYIKDYDLVLKLDADQIITGDLSYIFNTKDYDVGTVLNWNRIDPQQYGYVQGWGILPPEYVNCGLVAMRSERFVHHWKVLCETEQFNRLQYKEQDLLNILVFYGNYNVRCFDLGDKPANYFSWHGLVSKGEWNRAIFKNNEIIVPKGEGERPFPDKDITLKVLHWGGGNNNPEKMQYRTRFNEDIVTRLDYLVNDNIK
jgi:hypothetical protein